MTNLFLLTIKKISIYLMLELLLDTSNSLNEKGSKSN